MAETREFSLGFMGTVEETSEDSVSMQNTTTIIGRADDLIRAISAGMDDSEDLARIICTAVDCWRAKKSNFDIGNRTKHD